MEEEGEDPYNEDNMEQVGSSAGRQTQEISGHFLKAQGI